MTKEELLDELISKYYDNQMNESEILSFEARIAKSKGIREYANRKCFEYYQITSSIKRVKEKLKLNYKHNLLITDKKSFINIYTIRFKRFYKHLRYSILNILRNNSQKLNRS